MSKKFEEQCFVCQRMFPYGDNHQYHVTYLSHYKIYACNTCRMGCEDGIASRLVIDRLFQHLDAEGIERPEPNENGWIPLE